MRAIWKGAVSFGLVNVPVRLYSATENHDLSFHQVRASDGSRIKYKRVAQADGEEVPYKEIAKLPRKEFARTVLRKYEDDLLLRAHFDLELMEVWAGYRKPEITQEGNVYRIGRYSPQI